MNRNLQLLENVYYKIGKKLSKLIRMALKVKTKSFAIYENVWTPFQSSCPQNTVRSLKVFYHSLHASWPKSFHSLGTYNLNTRSFRRKKRTQFDVVRGFVSTLTSLGFKAFNGIKLQKLQFKIKILADFE